MFGALCAGVCGTASAEPAPEILEPVFVYTDRAQSDPGSYAVLDGAEITSTFADHPAEVLNLLPGVNIHTNSGQEHLIAIRSPVLTGGAGQGSFLILENGVPVRSPAFGNVNSLFELHHETAGAIEVVRGPGSARYGSNAVHGLINVIQAEPEGSRALDLTASYSSLNRYRGDIVANTPYGLRAALSLQDEVGWRDNTGLQQQKLTLTSTHSLGSWQVEPFLSVSNLNQETAGFLQGDDAYEDADFATTNANPEAYRDAFSARAHLRITGELGDGELTVIPFARTQEMDFNLHFLPYPGIEENGHDAAGLSLIYDPRNDGAVDVRFGLDTDFASGYLIETQTGPFGFFPGDSRFPEGRHYDYDVDTRMAGLWGEVEWDIGAARVLAGLRGETHHYDYSTNIPAGTFGRFRVSPDRTDSFDLLTPKLGIIIDATDALSLYANYARGERAPQASDLYRLQSLQVPGEVETETLDSFEVGARGSALSGALVFDVAAYVAEKENFFFRDGDGLNVPDGETEHMGIEAAFDWQLMPDVLSLSGQVSWSDQNYTFERIVGSASNSIREGDPIDTAPEWLADLAVTWIPADRLETQLSLDHVGEYTTNPAGTQTYPGHTVLNARASYVLRDSLEAFVIVRNLTDERYADRADFAFGNERYFPGEPLNATVGVRARFE
ncbi:MAG: TonB-dependent receptor [Pseudomonadota bacterium]